MIIKRYFLGSEELHIGVPFKGMVRFDGVDQHGEPTSILDEVSFGDTWLEFAEQADLDRVGIRVEIDTIPDPEPGPSPMPVTMTDRLINSLEAQGIVTPEQAAQLRRDIAVG